MVQLEFARTIDCDGLLDALAATGLEARRGDGDCTVEVSGSHEDVESAVDAWILEHDLPLVPERLADGVWMIRPPGD